MNNSVTEHNMEFAAEMTEDQRIAFMMALARLANADGKLDADEREFIGDMAKIYGISEARIGEILDVHNDAEIIEAVKCIDNRRVALELVKEMCMLAHADNELSENETLLIGKVGLAMGVDLDKIAQISQWVIDHIIWLEEAKVIFEDA